MNKKYYILCKYAIKWYYVQVLYDKKLMIFLQLTAWQFSSKILQLEYGGELKM